MKKAIMIIVSTVLALLHSCGTEEELLEKTELPNGTRAVEAYRVNGGATVAYSVKVYLTDHS